MDSLIQFAIDNGCSISFLGNVDLIEFEGVDVFTPIGSYGLCLVFWSFELIFACAFNYNIRFLSNYWSLLNGSCRSCGTISSTMG